jgi:fucose permease
VVLLGTGLILAGSLLVLTIGQRTPQLFLMAAMVVTGLGMGFGATSFLVAVQSSVGWSQRGIATASVQFFRSIGGAIGVAIMGALMNSSLSQGLLALGRDGGPITGDISSASVLLDPAARATLPPAALEAIRAVFASSLHSVYLAIALAAAVGLALTFLFPRITVEEQTHRAVPPAPSRSAGDRA